MCLMDFKQGFTFAILQNYSLISAIILLTETVKIHKNELFTVVFGLVESFLFK